MRKFNLFAISFVLIWLISGATAQALTYDPVDTFDDWTHDPWGSGIPVTITTNGNRATVNANGSGGETWGGLYKQMNGTIGMKATINASSVQGNTEVGIMNSVGTIGNERIKAIAFVKQNDSGKKYIGWAVKAKDLTSGVQRQLAAGVFGEWDKTWTTGKNITVMFKRIGNEIQFNVQGYPSTVKWKPKSSMNSLDWSPEIWAWAANGNNKVKATIKSVYIIYP